MATATDSVDSILSSAILKSSDIKSFHLSITVSGSVNESAIMAASGAKVSGAPKTVKLDGTTVSGNVDVTNEAADLTLAAPAFGATGEIIVAGGNLYYKTSLTGAKFTMMPLGSASLPIASVSPEAIASLTLSDAITQLRAEMTQAGVSVALVGSDQIGGQAANHFSLTLPLDKINSSLAGSGAGSGVTLTSASVDFWLYTSDLSLAQIVVKGDAGTMGNLALTLTVTAYNQPVTISAPPASQVQP
jgi:hypothetical protein